ncbi:hypothetical protein [Pseudosulfitobacter sp. SM2401]|uniref:hypothetical protein n=1 Tax=Pseudosulfitobacter sp. SM2401 TaxID=3350098 RepID=UPI0036F230AA
MKELMISACVATLLSGCLSAQTSTALGETVPVMLYPDTDHGTCSIGLQVNAGGADLRSGPGPEFPIIARLQAGHVVSGCDEQNGWDGVIDGTSETCSVGITVSEKQAYVGRCDSGWIDPKSLTSIYG